MNGTSESFDIITQLHSDWWQNYNLVPWHKQSASQRLERVPCKLQSNSSATVYQYIKPDGCTKLSLTLVSLTFLFFGRKKKYLRDLYNYEYTNYINNKLNFVLIYMYKQLLYTYKIYNITIQVHNYNQKYLGCYIKWC